MTDTHRALFVGLYPTPQVPAAQVALLDIPLFPRGIMCAMKQHSHSPSPQPYLIRPRIYLCPDLIVGPGKIELLKAVRDTGSISAAARTLGMSYKRAWYLLDTLKKGFHQPVFEASPGGGAAV